VIHHERLAWDGARALVRAADDEVTFAAVAQRIVDLLPAAYWHYYIGTRNRVLRPDRDDVINLEAALWRVRLEELLVREPGLTAAVRQLAAEAAALGSR
jgi:hypothetical protein